MIVIVSRRVLEARGITGRAEYSDTSLSKKPQIPGPTVTEGGRRGCFRNHDADETILREITKPATRPATRRRVCSLERSAPWTVVRTAQFPSTRWRCDKFFPSISPPLRSNWRIIGKRCASLEILTILVLVGSVFSVRVLLVTVLSTRP